MYCRQRRFSSTLTATIVFAALALPSSTMALSQPTPAAPAALQQRLTKAQSAHAVSSKRLAEADARVSRADAAITRVEAVRPRDMGETVVHVLKVSLSPFNDSFRDDTVAARQAAKRLAVLYAEREQALSMLADALAELARVDDMLDAAASALAEAERRAAEEVAAAEAARAVAAEKYGRFPVDGPVEYINSWGLARSGGRSHKGADIMARRGTPVVAAHDGTIRVRTSSLGGLTLYLTADDGVEYYYAHLDTVAVHSGRVTIGQVIGAVGSSGNASASAPHLHFEIHTPSPVNPYPILKRMVR